MSNLRKHENLPAARNWGEKVAETKPEERRFDFWTMRSLARNRVVPVETRAMTYDRAGSVVNLRRSGYN
jgi:hypothetical protein